MGSAPASPVRNDSPVEEAGFEPSVPGYGEFGRIWARATARSPGWLAWPLVLDERFPLPVRVNPRLERLLGAVRDLSRRLDWSTKNSGPSGFPDQVGIVRDRQSEFPS
jgi:hypothetical protein